MTQNSDLSMTANDRRDLSSGATESFAPETTLIHQLLRFFRLASLRKGIIIACCAICTGLGALYYITATRMYLSQAQLMIINTGANVMADNSSSSDRLTKDMMLTFQAVMMSETVIRDALKHLPKDQRVDFRGMKASQAVKAFQNNLNVTAVRHTNVLALSYISTHNKAAAAALKSLLKSYVDFMDRTHHGQSQDNLEILTKQRAAQEALLVELQNEYQILQRTSQFIDSGEKPMNPLAERVKQLNDLLVIATKEALVAKGDLDALNDAVRNGEDVMQYVMTNMEVVGRDFLMNELGMSPQENYALNRMNDEIIKEQGELRVAQEKYGPNHRHVQQLIQSIRAKKEYIEGLPEQKRKATERLKREHLGPKILQYAQQRYHKAVETRENLRQEFIKMEQEALKKNAEFSKIASLSFKIKNVQDYLEEIVERMGEIDLANQSNGIQMAVIADPLVPDRPISPRLTSVIAIVVVSGFGLGLFVVYILDVLDDRFRTAEELRYVLGIPILSMIREMVPGAGKGIDAVQTHALPNSIEGEAFRMLKTTIDFMDSETSRVAITSSEPGDGKTTVLANLAVAYAQSGKRTLLIDADMRRPGLTSLLDLRGDFGLSRILHDERAVGDAVGENLIETGSTGLHVIPSGPRPPNPAELLASTRFADLLEWADGRYDQVLIDAPPVLAVTDPAIVGRVVDGMVLVVRPDKNHRRTVIRAVETLTGLNCHLLGLVANHLNPQSEKGYGYGYGYGYEYGYGHDEATNEAHGPLPEDRYTDAIPLNNYAASDSGDHDDEYRYAA
ncbi:MAG: polysaccharide biosynthesis tyrosine autokinase [Planctomycetota bacterium]|nr:polysaccharide biosynthesis tyrosine autokinase [Planctomycetota bacterium]MDA1211154.1 polysaccharide biosynthesis tyrosine autokinase [Planctomycetota bacterium]